MNYIKKSKKVIFYLTFIVFIVTLFLKNSLLIVSDYDSSVYNEPIQTELSEPIVFNFENNGYDFKAISNFQYEISGLVVSRKGYRLFSTNDFDDVFPYDYCLIWGNNIKNEVHKEVGTRFSQDQRFCFYRNFGKTNLNINQLSNSHLVYKSDEIEKIAKNIKKGDQVRIKGYLVDVEAKKSNVIEGDTFNWKTSTVRTDVGKGACEVIFVESLEIIKPGNPLLNLINKSTFYLMLSIILYSVLRFFFAAGIFKNEKDKTSLFKPFSK